MIQRIIKVGHKDLLFRASAALPLLYRNIFLKDIFRDFSALWKHKMENNEENLQEDVGIFIRIAYAMAKHADPNLRINADEWVMELGFSHFFSALPRIMEVWGMNTEQYVKEAEKAKRIDREMTTPLFVLRCMQMNLRLEDLEKLTVGFVEDMVTESRNDGHEYAHLADQEDFDRF